MSGKTIWILNHHAHENGNRHFELGKELSGRGYNVIVIASSFSQATHSYRSEDDYNVHEINSRFHFVYLRTTPAYQTNGVKRVQNMFSYLHKTAQYTNRIAADYGKPDCVIGSSVHPLSWEAAFRIAKKYKAKFICEIRDIWPLSLVEVNGMSKYHPLVLFFGIIEKRAYARADAIVTTFPLGYKYVCEDMHFVGKTVKWIPNGIRIEEASEEELPSAIKGFLEGGWSCVYTGSFVKSESIDFLIDALSELRNTNIRLALIGSGHEQQNLERKITELDLNNVKIFPRIKKNQVLTALRAGKCCVAAAQDHPIYRFGLSMNKLNDYLLSGRPVAFACNYPNIVQDVGQFALKYGDPKAFADTILRIQVMDPEELDVIGNKSKALIKQQYDYSVIAERYIELFQ